MIIRPETQSRIDSLLEAQDLINEAIELIKDSLHGTEHLTHAEAYIIAHLDNWANGGNPYDYNILKYIEELEREDIEFANNLEEEENDID